ncbi:MAG: glycosyltransferase [archaeon]
MKKGKVCILTSVHPINDPRIFHKQTKSLVNAGYDVTLIAQHNKEEKIDGIKIVPLAKPDNRWERIFKTSLELFKKALKEDADIYHFHDPELILFGLLLKLKDKKVIYDVHEDYITSIKQKSYLPSFIRTPLAFLVDKVERLAAKFFEVIIAEKYYERRFPDSTKILNYSLKNKLDLANNEGQKEDLKLLYTGNITKDRGALNHTEILNCVDNIELYMIGKCNRNLASEMRNIAGKEIDRFHLEGEGQYVPYQNILEYYKEGNWLAGLAIFPETSHYNEKELTKFFEYMAAGIPIICSDFPVWRELMKDTGAGITVDPEDLNSVVEVIEFLKNNPEEARNMSENGKQAVQKEYNWKNEEQKLLNLYRNILD